MFPQYDTRLTIIYLILSFISTKGTKIVLKFFALTHYVFFIKTINLKNILTIKLWSKYFKKSISPFSLLQKWWMTPLKQLLSKYLKLQASSKTSTVRLDRATGDIFIYVTDLWKTKENFDESQVLALSLLPIKQIPWFRRGWVQKRHL